MTKETYTIDASGKTIGRIATEAAVCLLGKRTPDVKKNIAKDVQVEIVNAGKIKIPPKKLRDKKYRHYSGYPGGLKEASLQEVLAKKGINEILIHAVEGMLPKNRLHKVRMKNLKIVV